MATVTKTKKPAAKKARISSKPASKSWIGSGRGMATIAHGVDLTQPTYKVGKFFE